MFGIEWPTVVDMPWNEKHPSTWSGRPLKLDKFTYLSSNISSTESDVNIYLPKAWTAIHSLLIIYKSDLSNKMGFFQAMAVSILLYWCTTWMLTKCMEKKLDGNHAKMLHAEQILEATLHKTAAVWPLTSHLKNHSNKMNNACRALVEKQR